MKLCARLVYFAVRTLAMVGIVANTDHKHT
jgi:hypothetical protein